ncbi:MAG: hypothetical protein U5K72_14615 [Balneolaceae bacterium]|nr:hypothetical protein [Balneolaceae bacterium]
MGFYNSINRNLIAPASDLLFRRSIFQKLKFLEESQWWDRDQLLAYQNERLRKIIRYAYGEIPFYRTLYDRHGIKPDDIETVDDLTKLPVIQKKDIRTIASQRNDRNVRAVKGISSGSTGKPLQYTKSMEAYSMHTAAGIRGWQWMGFSLGDKYMKISQNSRSGLIKRMQDKVNRSRYIFLKEINDDEFARLFETIQIYGPDYLRCYPDPLYFFARYLQKNDLQLPAIKAINTTGNILYPEARALIEEQLNAPIHDAYSCEGGAVFYQTSPGSPYYGADEYAITEVMDAGGNRVKAGENGRLVTTDLWNREVPFIRYDTQDVVTLASDKSNSSQKRIP